MIRIARLLGLALLLAGPVWARGLAAAAEPSRPEGWEVRSADLYGVTSHEAFVWAVGYWGTVLRSSDAGLSWQRVETRTHRTLYDVSFADANHGWAVGEGGTVLRTVDGGLTWGRQAVPADADSGDPAPLDAHLFGVSAVSPTEAWAVGDLGVVLHLRDGKRWERVSIAESVFGDDETPRRIFNAVEFLDPARGWIVGEFGTILRSVDRGQSWTGERRFTDAPPDLYLFDISVLDERRAAVSGLAGMVLVTGDGGETWRPHRTGVATALYGVAWGNPSGVAVGDRGEIRMTSGFRPSWRSPERPALFNWLGAVSDSSGTPMYAVGERGVVLRSDDGGSSWSLILGGEPQPLGSLSVPEPSGTLELGVGVRRMPAPPPAEP